MLHIKPKDFLLYCGLKKEQFDLIRPLIWKRNDRILSITSLLAVALGSVFLVVNLLIGSGVWFPYAFLLVVSLIVTLLNRANAKRFSERYSMVLCYVQMVTLCFYAGILSAQPSNYSVPATSIVVFIAIMPLTIDDRPIKMFGFMLAESALYLTASAFLKDRSVFSLDVQNALTFCLIGMLIYSVICVRNIREISQGVQMDRIQQSVISSLATVVEERDESTGGHIRRTEDYIKALADRMKTQEKYAKIPDDYFRSVILAAPMHDIGKIKISDSILNKPGRLTPEEFEVMKKHADYGAVIIRKTMADIENEDYFEIACNIACYHHERYDGKGYPEGLAGENIPLEARMMALADVYDALISERVYKKAFSKEEAERIMLEGSGTQFDPDLLPLFLECVRQ